MHHSQLWSMMLPLVCGIVCVCVLALQGFASQTQFSNSSGSLHYSYRSEPADRVTPGQYRWYFKVPFANITWDTLTVMDIQT